MIASWHIKAFKSVRDSGVLRFAPITLLVGSNSSGKSTILQSILAVAQSTESRISANSLVLNGPLVQLGDMDEIRCNFCHNEFPGIAFEIDTRSYRGHGGATAPFRRGGPFPPEFMAESIVCRFSIMAREDEGVREKLHPRVREASLVMTGGLQGPAHIEMTLRESPQRREGSKSPVKRDLAVGNSTAIPEYRITKGADSEVDAESAGVVGGQLWHFVPGSVSLRYDAHAETAAQIAAILIGTRSLAAPYRLVLTDPTPVEASWLAFVSNLVSDTTRAQLNAATQAKMDAGLLVVSELGAIIRKVLTREEQKKLEGERVGLEGCIRGEVAPDWRLRQLGLRADAQYLLATQFGQLLKYVGPLRDDPRALYPLSTSVDAEDVGRKGEYAAAVLSVHSETVVEYVDPAAFVKDGLAAKVRKGSLAAAVQQWASHIGVANRSESRGVEGGLGYRLSVGVDVSGGMRSLNQVGVGVSQALPILVLALLAARGTTLILEQPELHLHPSVQARLADFFIALTMVEKQCIVETHSEYIISRLRLKCAQDPTAELHERVALYFVEMKDDGSHYRRIGVTEAGSLSEWPTGFFDTSEIESSAILRAALERRKKRKGEDRAE
ncbi:MAG: DUF3696 domain-containing protein [Planctomycetes bacterium]|nr:DUF3696 domain-containing protein [Planctomycetota bacterium]